MLKYTKVIGLILVSLFLACSKGSDNEASGSTSNNISGRWYVKVSFATSAKADPFVADIQQTDTTFTGIMSWGTMYVNSFSGVIIGSELNFHSVGDTLHFDGRVVSSDSVNGTWYNKFTGDSGTWVAVRPFNSYNIMGGYTGRFMFLSGTHIDTVNVQSGLWKGKAFTTTHNDTVFFAGEMLSIANGDTVSALVPMGGLLYKDTLFIDFGCRIRDINGKFVFTGKVVTDSVSGSWRMYALSGLSMFGEGNFSGNISGIK